MWVGGLVVGALLSSLLAFFLLFELGHLFQ